MEFSTQRLQPMVMKCYLLPCGLHDLKYSIYRKNIYRLNVKRLNMTANRTYEGAQSELQNVLTKDKGKKLIYFIYYCFL